MGSVTSITENSSFVMEQIRREKIGVDSLAMTQCPVYGLFGNEPTYLDLVEDSAAGPGRDQWSSNHPVAYMCSDDRFLPVELCMEESSEITEAHQDGLYAYCRTHGP